MEINGGRIFIFCVYVPPASAIHLYNEIIECINYITDVLCEDEDEILILGDFNLPKVDWVTSEDDDYMLSLNVTSEIEHTFLDGLSSAGLHQINNIANNNNRYLDLIFSTMSSDLALRRCYNSIVPEDKHHPTLFLSMQTNFNNNFEYLNPLNDDIYSFNFKRADYEKINSSLADFDWNILLICDDFDKAVNVFYNFMFDCFIQFVPLYCKRNTIVHHPWYDNNLRFIRNRRNNAWKTYCNSGLESDFSVYQLLCNRFCNTLSCNYASYLINIQGNLNKNPKDFWKFINNKRYATGYPSKMTYLDNKSDDPGLISNMFATYFGTAFDNVPGGTLNMRDFEHLQSFDHLGSLNLYINSDEVYRAILTCKVDYSCGPDGIPSALLNLCALNLSLPLSILFNMSLSYNLFPKIWREFFITPLHKGGARDDVSNYRPIAKLSTIPKLFEAIVTKTVIFNIKSVISSEQHGFMCGRSTTTNLLEFVTFCTEKLVDRSQVDCVFTDFSKAFDKLSHEILLFKLTKLGFNKNFVSWIESYLRQRTCKVVFNGCVSNILEIGSGIPQGSHFGPILFILFINDLPCMIKHSKCLMYADDVKIFKPINNVGDCIDLQSDLMSFYDWCKTNRLSLNIDKCKVMGFTRKNSEFVFSYHFDGSILPFSNSIRDLGIYLDKKLTFSHHIDFVVNRANSVLGFIKRELREMCDPYCAKTLFIALVRSITEYACQVWSPHCGTHIARIESIQRRFIIFALRNLPWSDPYRLPSYEDRLRLLNMPTLHRHRDYLRLSFISNLLNGRINCPGLLARLFLRINSRNLRSMDLFLINSYRTNYGRFSPLNSMLLLYNEFSDKINSNNVKDQNFKLYFLYNIIVRH